MKSSRHFGARRATQDDIGTLVSLMHDFYAESHYPLDAEWATSSFATLLADPSLGGAWLVLENDKPVGHIVLSLRYGMEHAGLIGYIDDLYVKPEARRCGAATVALTALMTDCRARGVKSVVVEASDGNAAALAAYAKFGLKRLTDGRVLLVAVLAQS